VDERISMQQRAREQEERARSARRRRLWNILFEASLHRNVDAVVPDVDDHLVEVDPLPNTDADFPISAVEF
jgi:hypothetical protein